MTTGPIIRISASARTKTSKLFEHRFVAIVDEAVSYRRQVQRAIEQDHPYLAAELVRRAQASVEQAKAYAAEIGLELPLSGSLRSVVKHPEQTTSNK